MFPQLSWQLLLSLVALKIAIGHAGGTRVLLESASLCGLKRIQTTSGQARGLADLLTIEIPEIVVLPSREVNFWFEDFDLKDYGHMRYQPISDKIRIRKRSVNENVINQGLFYLDWLLDHRKEFQWLVMERLGPEAAKAVDWTAPRLLCIAGDFTRYDEHAVKQIARNIELIRYRRFGDDLLMMELVHAPKTARVSAPAVHKGAASETSPKEEVDEADPYWRNRMGYCLSQASAELRDIYDAVQQFLVGLGDDVQVKELQQYTGFKRIKNFVCLQIYPQARSVVAYLKLDPSTVDLEEGFSRDVTSIGHHGTGDLELSLKSMGDFERAQPLLRRAYEGG